MDKYIPDRKVLGGGIVGVLGFFLGILLGLETEAATGLAGSFWATASYFIKPSTKDILARADEFIKHQASLPTHQKKALKDAVSS